MNPLIKYRLKKMYLPVAIATVAGSIIGLFINYFFENGFEIADCLDGAIIGFLISFFLQIFEIFLARHVSEKIPPSLILFFNTLVYFFIVFIVSIFGMIIIEGSDLVSLYSLLHALEFQIILAAGFILCVVIQFFYLIDAYLGKGVLPSILAGRYYRPQKVERIFMLLDVKGFTGLAEKLGDENVLSFLNSFFSDVSNAVILCKGDIYRYVGDEIIVTWPVKQGIVKARSLCCFFMIKEFIKSREKRYMQRYGVVPEFRAALHCGSVIMGELGNIKREVSYIGDVLNTAARIEEVCKEYNTDILISKRLLTQLQLPETLRADPVLDLNLRGKSDQIHLYTVEEKENHSSTCT